VLDGVPVNQIQAVTDDIRAAVRRELPDICNKIEAAKRLSQDDRNELLRVSSEIVANRIGEDER
jgi:F0F1-type ATP synthase alpha subunit